MPKVLIILGSKSDMPVAEKSIAVFEQLSIDYSLAVASAHRTPDRVEKLVEETDAGVIIAVAGLSAALPGVVASLTIKPVIGVPVSGKLNLDSILSVVQMPGGVPVAAVGLDRGDNAAVLAAEIFALNDKKTAEALKAYRKKQAEKVAADSAEVEKDVRF